MLVGRDARQRAANQLDPDLGQRRRELVSFGGLMGERLLDRQRLVNEIGFGSQQSQVGQIAGEVGQGQSRFEPGDPAAGDQDPGRHQADTTSRAWPAAVSPLESFGRGVTITGQVHSRTRVVETLPISTRPNGP